MLRGLGVMAQCAIVGIGFVLVIEAALDPWARSLTGAPVLVGEWLGHLTTPTGNPRVVRFAVLPIDQMCATCPDINAVAQMCDERGVVSSYDLWGDTANWRGTRFSLRTAKLEDEPVGVKLGNVEGEWDTDGVVRLTTTLRADPDTATLRSELDPATGVWRDRVLGPHPDTLAPVTFELHRALECRVRQRLLTAKTKLNRRSCLCRRCACRAPSSTR